MLKSYLMFITMSALSLNLVNIVIKVKPLELSVVYGRAGYFGIVRHFRMSLESFNSDKNLTYYFYLRCGLPSPSLCLTQFFINHVENVLKRLTAPKFPAFRGISA